MNWAEFHFIRPWWLLALLPAAAMLMLLLKNHVARGNWADVCDAELMPFILQHQPSPQRRSYLLAASLATLLCILALAGPTWQRLPSPAFRNDSALVIALDLSKSMNATDTKPSRLSKARYKIADILQLRKDGQTALLVYGGDAFIVTPLTTDIATINSQLEALTTNIMPSPGSNTQLAIDKSAELLRQAGLTKGHILLVTDSNADHAAAPGDYQLSILALGTTAGAPIPAGGGGFVKDAAGNIVIAKLDSAGLSELAAAGHGLYQTVTANDDDIKNLSSLFNRAEPGSSQEQSDLLLEQWDDKGPWLALLLLPWAALRFRKGLLSLLLLCLLPMPREAAAFDWQSLWQTPDQQAQKAFESQQFEQAATQFNDPNWRAAAQFRAGQYQQAAETLKDAQTADGLYNLGNALAKAGQFQQALEAYQQALKLDPKHSDAKFNKELIEKQQQQQKQQQGKDQQSSDQQDQQQDQSKSDQSSAQGEQDDQQQQSNPQDQSQNQSKKADENKADAEQQDSKDAKDGEQKNPEQKDAKSQAAEQKTGKEDPEAKPAEPLEAIEQTEAQRANQQLLNRIPDQPTGLLKRKFRYQYGQRRQLRNPGADW